MSSFWMIIKTISKCRENTRKSEALLLERRLLIFSFLGELPVIFQEIKKVFDEGLDKEFIAEFLVIMFFF